MPCRWGKNTGKLVSGTRTSRWMPTPGYSNCLPNSATPNCEMASGGARATRGLFFTGGAA